MTLTLTLTTTARTKEMLGMEMNRLSATCQKMGRVTSPLLEMERDPPETEKALMEQKRMALVMDQKKALMTKIILCKIQPGLAAKALTPSCLKCPHPSLF